MYYEDMNPLYIFATIVAGLFLTFHQWKVRQLVRKAADAELEALRSRRESERLALVLRQFEPELFAHVKARSEMEWQQAIKRLDEGELPVLFPLEKSFTAIGITSRQ